MIISDRFLKDIAGILRDLSLIQSPYLRKIASWVLDYYEQNGESPKTMIQDIFLHHRTDMEEEIAESIEAVLTHLNDKYLQTDEKFNVNYHYKRSETYLTGRSLLALSSDIKALVAENEMHDAEATIADYKKVGRPSSAGIDILKDVNVINKLFSEEEQTLFKIPGAFGEAIKDVYRGDVIAFGGASKKGKSWYLMEMAKIAMMSGLKVAYFTLEMKEIIMARRIFQNFTGQPKHPMPDGVSMPYFEDDCIKYKFIEKEGMNLKDTKKFQKKFDRQIRTGKFRLYDGSSGGTTVSQICSTLDRDAYFEDFVADVVVIDYADIIEVEYKRGDPREQSTATWISLRRDIAQKRNCLVITASQLGRQAIKNDGGVADIAENIRKFDQMSHFILLNQSPAEKKAQLMRIKVEGRHDEFEVMDEVVCLQCLSVGRPIVGSMWKRNIKNYGDVLESVGGNNE